MRDNQPNDEQLKIELFSQWKLEAESRNNGVDENDADDDDL